MYIHLPAATEVSPPTIVHCSVRPGNLIYLETSLHRKQKAMSNTCTGTDRSKGSSSICYIRLVGMVSNLEQLSNIVFLQ